MSAMTFYFDPTVVFDRISKVAKPLVQTSNLDEAQEVLKRRGVPSELTFERNFVWRRYAGKDRLFGGKK
jgi:hypothetical protein